MLTSTPKFLSAGGAALLAPFLVIGPVGVTPASATEPHPQKRGEVSLFVSPVKCKGGQGKIDYTVVHKGGPAVTVIPVIEGEPFTGAVTVSAGDNHRGDLDFPHDGVYGLSLVYENGTRASGDVEKVVNCKQQETTPDKPKQPDMVKPQKPGKVALFVSPVKCERGKGELDFNVDHKGGGPATVVWRVTKDGTIVRHDTVRVSAGNDHRGYLTLRPGTYGMHVVYKDGSPANGGDQAQIVVPCEKKAAPVVTRPERPETPVVTRPETPETPAEEERRTAPKKETHTSPQQRDKTTVVVAPRQHQTQSQATEVVPQQRGHEHEAPAPAESQTVTEQEVVYPTAVNSGDGVSAAPEDTSFGSYGAVSIFGFMLVGLLGRRRLATAIARRRA